MEFVQDEEAADCYGDVVNDALMQQRQPSVTAVLDDEEFGPRRRTI